MSETPSSLASTLKPTSHPLLPVLSPAEVEEILGRPDGAELYAKWFNAREKLIKLSEENPYQHAFRLPHWKDADVLLKDADFLYVAGGNRASKSEWAAYTIVKSAMTYQEGVIWCFQENESTSIGTQQKLIWKYLPPEIKALNEKRHPVYKVKYSQAGGFTEGKLILPNRTEIWFLTYNQEPGEFQGWELGAPRRYVTADVPNIGAWADENMIQRWLENLKFRLATRGAKAVWTYTPIDGITVAIKDFMGVAQTIQTRPAELLSDRVNIPGLPKGHMPYVQVPTTPNARVIYFHSDLNPFGGYDVVKKLCEGKNSEFVERRAYGYARDTMHRAFPLFGSWNIVKAKDIPAKGTNYMLTDPAGARNWASLWARVTPGNPASIFIYRDWPDAQTYGEWAKPSDNPNQPDGSPGPAQRTLGYGVVRYKQLFLALERILIPGAVVDLQQDAEEVKPQTLELLEKLVKDPHRRHRIIEAIESGEDLQQLQEWIRERLIDPRAGRNQRTAEKGGTCLVDEFSAIQKDEKTGEIKGPSMHFIPASGVDIQEGLTAINTLLYWEKDEPLMPLVNEPHLYISEDCHQVIWAMENYTARGGETGACKDFIDLLRYMALGRLRYIAPGGIRTTGGGSY